MSQMFFRVVHAKFSFCFGLIFLCTILTSPNLLAQNPRTVSGVITDAKKTPLQGVSVVLKGSARGVSTDQNGKFVLNDVPSNGVLVLSYTGMNTQEVSVNNKNSISVSMAEAVNNLNLFLKD